MSAFMSLMVSTPVEKIKDDSRSFVDIHAFTTPAPALATLCDAPFRRLYYAVLEEIFYNDLRR